MALFIVMMTIHVDARGGGGRSMGGGSRSFSRSSSSFGRSSSSSSSSGGGFFGMFRSSSSSRPSTPSIPTPTVRPSSTPSSTSTSTAIGMNGRQSSAGRSDSSRTFNKAAVTTGAVGTATAVHATNGSTEHATTTTNTSSKTTGNTAFNTAKMSKADQLAYNKAKQNHTVFPNKSEAISSFKQKYSNEYRSKYPVTFNSEPKNRPSYVRDTYTDSSGNNYRVIYDSGHHSYGYYGDGGRWNNYDIFTNALLINALMDNHHYYVPPTQPVVVQTGQAGQTSVIQSQPQVIYRNVGVSYFWLMIWVILAVVITWIVVTGVITKSFTKGW